MVQQVLRLQMQVIDALARTLLPSYRFQSAIPVLCSPLWSVLHIIEGETCIHGPLRSSCPRLGVLHIGRPCVLQYLWILFLPFVERVCPQIFTLHVRGHIWWDRLGIPCQEHERSFHGRVNFACASQDGDVAKKDNEIRLSI